LFAPARTPRAIVEKIQTDTVTALSDPIVKQRLEQIGMVVSGSTSEELAALLQFEIEKWDTVIKDAKITLD